MVFVILHDENMADNNFYVFASEYHREVARIGLESIELWYIRTKYLNFIFYDYTYVSCVFSYIIVKLAQLFLKSVTILKLYAEGRYQILNQCKSN